MALEGMRGKVGILGFGMSKFGPNLSRQDYTHYAATAYVKALKCAGISPDDIENVVYGHYNPLFRGQIMGDIYVNEAIGMELRPTLRVAAGGATGAAAIDAGVTYALSGRADIVLVLGFEKCSDTHNFESGEGISEALKAISFSADTVWEESLGFTAASSYAHTVNAFVAEHEGHPNDEEASIIAVNHHNNALYIPEAHCYGQKEVTVEKVMASPMISSPFRRGHNCQISEGAAALILITERKARELGVADRVVWITGIGCATDTGMVGLRPTIAEYMSGSVAMRRAYAAAGITNPQKELGAVEIHDPFAHVVYMAIMEIGICRTWQETSRLIRDGFFARDGRLPMNLSGGLIGMGHPVGATNIAQAGWLFLQLTGQAGASQVDFSGKPRAAALKGMGGPGDCYCYGIVLQR
ncbi:MAG: thiolase family protein [Deltaproteobacteria bacterium]|nr:thiolase family protein [Deltaproteobacteria bacterium]